MKANYLDRNKAMRKFKELVNKEQQKNCEKCLERLNREYISTSEFNAKLHVLLMLLVVHDKKKYGKERLEELLNEYNEAAIRLKVDLEDGVAWTKIRKRFQEIGIEFEDESVEIANRKERLYEKDITYYDKKKRRR